ncbi:transducin/WD40 repeat-like superfamily protein [Actinidia rufa]|uniref:Transducin/WD40 repeat-like superfamily protein n=1 Tax=Actinidia rufa TaxID=165716 RepID=A0A7J0EH61_9ERIC|nr:transducin/WD40 repeat-like superfamily protein [Actinidia rufa]
MEQFQNHELENMVEDDYDMTDFEEDIDSQRNGVDESLDSDFEDDFEMSKPKTDTSAVEARNGKDIQGIPWERLNFTRDKYREMRLKQYKNYENLSRSRNELEKHQGTPTTPVNYWCANSCPLPASFHPNCYQLQFFYCVVAERIVLTGMQASGEGPQLLRLPVQYEACQIDNCAFSEVTAAASIILLLYESGGPEWRILADIFWKQQIRVCISPSL